jgi:hypothetical protein
MYTKDIRLEKAKAFFASALHYAHSKQELKLIIEILCKGHRSKQVDDIFEVNKYGRHTLPSVLSVYTPYNPEITSKECERIFLEAWGRSFEKLETPERMELVRSMMEMFRTPRMNKKRLQTQRWVSVVDRSRRSAEGYQTLPKASCSESSLSM